MNKTHRCLLHLACIVVKTSRGKNSCWHREHLLLEFGMGTLANSTPASGS